MCVRMVFAEESAEVVVVVVETVVVVVVVVVVRLTLWRSITHSGG